MPQSSGKRALNRGFFQSEKIHNKNLEFLLSGLQIDNE